MPFFIDRKYALPRIWSNRELEKFAHLFSGRIVNVSAWKDHDKEGKHYKDYFVNAHNYTITNYKKEARGFQGYENEIFVDLERPIPANLRDRFDVVFNHTVLEHTYDVQIAFSNICAMTTDIVILVIPFLQQMHAAYGDYWRFTPLTIRRAFHENRLSLIYLSYNSHKNASVYIFAIASKKPSKWAHVIRSEFSYIEKQGPRDGFEPYVGCHAIQNTGYVIWRQLKDALTRFRRRE